MTEEEYFQKKKQLQKKIDKSLILYMQHKVTLDEHHELIKQWKELLSSIKTETWFKHI